MGFNYTNDTAKKIAVKMQNTLKKRGPNQRGIYITPTAVLAHTRLAVVDIERGRQPMHLIHNGQKFTVVYNGELYNTDDIRKELFRLNHSFIGTGDTEVLLHAYAEWGEKCVEKFNGIFAFAILNETDGELFIARDRIGVKPFFYYIKDGKFIFGSEISTVLSHPAVPHIVDKNGILEVVLIGPGRTIGNGIFKDVYELPPAGYCRIDINNLKNIKMKKYWQLTENPYIGAYTDAVAEVRHLVTDAVERQLVSDVPVGTFLSGGIDSSVISAIAKRGIENLQTFSVDYNGNGEYFRPTKFQPNDDQYYISVMNRHLRAAGSKSVINTPDLVKSLYKAVDARGVPGMADIDGSLLLFCGDIKRKVTVAISGECADEIFGGYPWYYDKTLREKNGFPWSQNTLYRAGFLKPKFLTGTNPQKFVHDKYAATVKKSNTTDRHRQMMQLNMDWFMQTLLDRKDRMSMYNGLEVRVPFCDYRLVELAYNLPCEFKYRNGVEKSVLRDAFADMLPAEILLRKKSPYPKTHNPEYLSAVSKILLGIIADKTQPIHKVIKKSALHSLLTDPAPQNWYGQLMTQPQTIAYFIQMNYWLKKFGVIIH